MIRTAIALLAALLALPALADGPAPKQPAKAARASPGKARAPATASARIGNGVATVTIRFDAPATDVTIGAGGVDGLTVTSDPTPLTGGRFARGQSVAFDVAFTPGPGRSHLAITVGGTFAGQQRHVAQTFAVGSPTADQLKAAVPATTDSTGQRIKVMPSDGK
jgi:hypothetical protein